MCWKGLFASRVMIFFSCNVLIDVKMTYNFVVVAKIAQSRVYHHFLVPLPLQRGVRYHSHKFFPIRRHLHLSNLLLCYFFQVTVQSSFRKYQLHTLFRINSFLCNDKDVFVSLSTSRYSLNINNVTFNFTNSQP